MTAPAIVYFDKKADRIYVASSAAFLKECQQSQGAIEKNPEYQQAFQDMPEDGNGMVFLSGKKLQSLLKTVVSAAPPRERPIMEPLVAKISAFLDFPLGYVYRHEANGTTVLINSKFVLCEANPVVGMMAIPVFAGLFGYKSFSASNAIREEDTIRREAEAIRREEEAAKPNKR